MQQDTEKIAFAHRLNEALSEAGVPAKFEGRQVVVAQMFGVTQKGARKWLEGEGMPTLEKSIEIAKRLGVAIEWLLTGRGARRVEGPEIEPIEQLPPDARQQVLDFMEFQATKALDPSKLTDYLRWLDHMRNHPPPAPDGGKKKTGEP